MPMSKKEIRKIANTFAKLHMEDAGRMMSLAIKGEERIYAHSSAPAAVATPLDPYPTYLVEYAAKLPWNGLTAVLARPHTTCAEAHVWCELMGRGKNPKSYTLVSFNADGIIASPCANCAQWVERAFFEVYKETPAYEGRTRQKP